MIHFRSTMFFAGLLTLPLLLATGCSTTTPVQRHRQELTKAGKDQSTFQGGLALRINPTKDTYSQKEQVNIDYRVSNISDTFEVPGEINVYGELKYEGFLITYDITKLGKDRKSAYMSKGVEIDVDKELAALSHYVRLQPGFFFGRPIRLKPGSLSPGFYEMIAYYSNKQKMCLLSPKLTPDQIRLMATDQGNEAFVTLWNGFMLKSNTIVFEVKE